jgi:alkylation response protein AidB-like acyl-CoA dehydrogenase
MEYGWGPDLEAFRAEVRALLDAHDSPELREATSGMMGEGGATHPAIQAVVDDIDARGWRHWSTPVEYGGEGRSFWYRYILDMETRLRGIRAYAGTASMVAPAIMQFGTEEQKSYYVPRIWSGEITCALGYSEPDAGTDLAALQTRAVRDGDEYVINGGKIWTSGAHTCNHVWLAVRTDPAAPKHRGISVLIVPLDSPGITIRPIWTHAGIRTNQVFYEDVRVPRTALIGEENRGWYIVTNALDQERVTVGVDDYTDLVRLFDRLMSYLEAERPELLAEPVARNKMADLKMRLRVHRALLLTNAALVARGETPTKEASMVKVWGTELRHQMASTAIDLLGRPGLLREESGEAAPLAGWIEQTFRRAPIIRFAGGTNEVQRNIIAQRGLGLPR